MNKNFFEINFKRINALINKIDKNFAYKLSQLILKTSKSKKKNNYFR